FHGKSIASWNTIALVRSAVSRGWCTTLAPIRTMPRLGGIKPCMRYNSVLLPHPLGPMIDMNLSRKDHVSNTSPGAKEFTNYYTENALDCSQAEPGNDV